MHQPIPEQGAWIEQVVRGFFAYHAVPTNGAALKAFYYYVERIWLRTLRRRSQKDRFSWQLMHRLAADWIPKPRILHPYPDKRFAVTHPRLEPCAGIPPARIWAVSNDRPYRASLRGLRLFPERTSPTGLGNL